MGEGAAEVEAGLARNAAGARRAASRLPRRTASGGSAAPPSQVFKRRPPTGGAQHVLGCLGVGDHQERGDGACGTAQHRTGHRTNKREGLSAAKTWGEGRLRPAARRRAVTGLAVMLPTTPTPHPPTPPPTRGQQVHRPALLHPLEQRLEQRAAQEVLNVVGLCIRDGHVLWRWGGAGGGGGSAGCRRRPASCNNTNTPRLAGPTLDC